MNMFRLCIGCVPPASVFSSGFLYSCLYVCVQCVHSDKVLQYSTESSFIYSTVRCGAKKRTVPNFPYRTMGLR